MPESPAITLYGRPGCHLCDDAEAILVRVAAELMVSYHKVNIESSPELFEEFRYRIPVIQIVGGCSQELDWPTTPARVRKAILAAAGR